MSPASAPGCRAAVLLLVALFFSSSARAADRRAHFDRQRRAILALLDAPRAHVTRAELDRIGPQVPGILRSVASSPGPSRRRAGAISLAGHYRRHARWLCSLAARSTPRRRRRAAIRACARADAHGAIGVLARTLTDPDLYIREASAYGLGIRCDARALRLLRARRLRDSSAAVRGAIRSVLSRCRPPHRHHHDRHGRKP